MENNKKSLDRVTLIGFLVLVLVFVGIFATYFIGQYLEEEGRKVKNEQIATVGEYSVKSPLYTFLFFSNKMNQESANGVQDSATMKTFWTSQKIGDQLASDWLKTQTANDVKEATVVYEEAKKAGITEADVKENMDTFIEANEEQFKQQGTTFDEFVLSTFHLKREDFIEAYTILMIGDEYRAKLLEEESAKISDADAEKYYKKNPDVFEQFMSTDVVHVLFKTTDDNNEKLSKKKIAEAKKNAQMVLNKVKAGEDIKKLAKKYSEDPGVAENDGLYTVADKTSYVEEFTNFAYEKNVGDAAIVESDYGYHVMKVISRKGDDFKSNKENAKNVIASNDLQDVLDQKIADAGEIKLNEDRVAGIMALLVREFNS